MEQSVDANTEFRNVVFERVNDPRRLAAVAATTMMDTGPTDGFDRIAAIVARLLVTPFAFVTLVDDSRSFWKSCIGVDATALEDRQNRVEESFCQYVIGLGDELLVNDTRLDPRTMGNPSIESMGVLAWAGVPLRSPDGLVLGTVCAVDTRPRSWTDDDALLMHDFAAIAADEISAVRAAVLASRSEALLSSILQRAPIGFALVDEDMRYEIVNDTLAGINGVPVSHHVGRTIGDVVPDIADAVTPLLRRVIDTGDPITGVDVRGVTASHPEMERTWSANYYRLDLDGDLRVGLFIEEITERAEARRRAQHLATISQRLARADSTDDVAAVIDDEIAGYFGARAAVVGLVEPATATISVLAGDRVLAALGDVVLTIQDDTAYGAALRTGEPVLVTDADDRAARFGRGFDVAMHASAAIPCRSSNGTIIAVMVIGWTHAITLDRFPSDQLNTMAALIGNVIERNRAADDRRHLIESLQNTLLHVPDEIDGMEIAVRYAPAGDALGFGGDWYDIIALDQHRTALVVGDVVGHDGIAAAHMTQIRTTFSDLLLLHTPLETVFDETNRLLQARNSTTMATVSVVLIDTSQRTLTAVSAGHLPALIMDPTGQVDVLTPALRPPLLVPGDQPATTPVEYQPGSILIMFTDGLIETRGSNIDDDLETLRRYVGTQSGVDPQTLADKLLADHADATHRADDIAIVCARLH